MILLLFVLIYLLTETENQTICDTCVRERGLRPDAVREIKFVVCLFRDNIVVKGTI